MDSDEDELEARAIADRLGVDWAELKARAVKNAEEIAAQYGAPHTWSVLKQARFEQFLRAEQATAKADSDWRKAGAQHANLNWHSQPDPEIKKIDPWEAVLVNVKGEPFHDQMRVHSRELMTETLGIAESDQHSALQRRLAECMRSLGWQGPKDMRIHSRRGRGFWRPAADTTLNASADSD